VHVLSPRIRIELLNVGNQLTGAYLVSNHQQLEYVTSITCEGDGMVEVALPEELHEKKNYCVCMELAEKDPIFESIKG
jgi:alpha-L-fucosidase